VQNNKTKTIRVSEDTINKLGKERVGFETPDECLNRMLSKSPCTKQEDEVVVEESNEEQEQ